MDRKWVAGQVLLALGLAVGMSLPWIARGSFVGSVNSTGWETTVSVGGMGCPAWMIFATAVFAVVMAACRVKDLWGGPAWIEPALLALGVAGCVYVGVIGATNDSVEIGIGWYVSWVCIATMAVRAVAALFGASPFRFRLSAAIVPWDDAASRRSRVDPPRVRAARLARRNRAATNRAVAPVSEPEAPSTE